MYTISLVLAGIACLGHGRRVQPSIPNSQSLAEVNAAFTPSAPGMHLPANGRRVPSSRSPSVKTGTLAVDGAAADKRVPPTSMASAIPKHPASLPILPQNELKKDVDVKPLDQATVASEPLQADMHQGHMKGEAKHWWNHTERLTIASLLVLVIMLLGKVGPRKSFGYLLSLVGKAFGEQSSRDTAADHQSSRDIVADYQADNDAVAIGWRPPMAYTRVAAPVMQTTADPTTRFIVDNPGNNVPTHIAQLVGRNLHMNDTHPLGIIKAKIAEYFNSLDAGFEMVDDLDPLVKAEQCFDDLLIPPDHPGRAPSDTYYVTRDGGIETASAADTLLRTHTSAHQSTLMRSGKEKFLCTGDVYRRDEIDRSHFPAFHQMEGVKLFDPELVGGAMTREEWLESPGCKLIADDLKKTLEGLCDHLFGPVEKRWIDEYFPFTEPSFELEIFYNGDWMEVLGCGVIHSGVLEKVGKSDRHGWAFGLGLERLAMVLFTIPDIRLFWSEDKRFQEQFKAGEISTFKPFSKYSPVFKDIAMWIPDDYNSNDFYELARGICGELVEKIELIDEFTNPKKGKTSHCYRITYRSMERTLTNEEIDKLQFDIRDEVEKKCGVELR